MVAFDAPAGDPSPREAPLPAVIVGCAAFSACLSMSSYKWWWEDAIDADDDADGSP